MKIALHLAPYPNEKWTLAKQIGVNHAVSYLPPDDKSLFGPTRPWEYLPLLHMKERFADAGLELSVIEGYPPMDAIRLGLADRDKEIDYFAEMLTNLGALGIRVVCYNFMARFNWVRTSMTTPTRGGALVTSYDHELMQGAPPHPDAPVSDEQLWENLAYFLERIVPVAEETGVNLALHPDDPPISPIRGVARIIRSVEAMRNAVDLVKSPRNGITMCQGTVATMGADVPAAIREFGSRGLIHFVHFRDVRGTAERFQETFHDDGQTDMLEAMRAYKEVGFDGPIRPDHAPTLFGETNENPGYEIKGRLFAVGYMKGLMEGVGIDYHG